MTDNTDLKRLAQRVIDIEALDGGEPIGEAWGEFEAAATPAAVLALIAENEALKGPHDWLAEDLIKELVDNAQAIQENADDGEDDPFVIVLLASASRIRRQEANIDKLRAENERLKAESEALRDDIEQNQYDANAWRNGEESVWIEVFNSEGDDPFISAITGQITVEQLALIQSEILE
ncbi:hypothetical protein SAMN04490192_3432 [Pseudomonas lundensis]|uniref:hypothetical protein n=1 Tax=Pseudomonas lundensis TaxID=86185 RepID=UPI00088571A6|nr:hypothetical protein [Pseudomonas lundensis]SDQ80734.1 hypothetical protein SAMN04490192_3432 [Pseudomonas lundensis]